MNRGIFFVHSISHCLPFAAMCDSGIGSTRRLFLVLSETLNFGFPGAKTSFLSFDHDPQERGGVKPRPGKPPNHNFPGPGVSTPDFFAQRVVVATLELCPLRLEFSSSGIRVSLRIHWR